MKMNVEWYQRNLDNSIDYCRRERKRLEKHLADLIKLEEDNEFLAYQIDCAYKEEKHQFDADKYKVKRKANDSK